MKQNSKVIHEKYEFRNIHKDEIEQAAEIESICFPPNEACTYEHMESRIKKASDLFLVVVDRETGKIAGFLNGLATDREHLTDDFFTDANLHDPEGVNIMLLGLDVRVITTYDTLKLFANLATKDDLFIVITLSGAHQMLADALGRIVQNESYIVVISNYERSLCSAYADLTFLIPKTNLLENHDTITREIYILMLFDIIFLNLLEEDEKSHEAFQKIAPFSSWNQKDND